MPSILGANTLSGGYDVANSLRFNDGDSPALTRSLGTTTLTTKGTFSFWVNQIIRGIKILPNAIIGVAN